MLIRLLLIGVLVFSAQAQIVTIAIDTGTATNLSGGSLGQVTNIVNASASASGSHSIVPEPEKWSFNLHAQASGYASNLNLVAFGDSTGGDGLLNIVKPLYGHFGSNGYAPFHPYAVNLSSANITNLTSANATNHLGAQWQVGSNAVDGHQQICTTNFTASNGGGGYVDSIAWILESSPTAGAVTLFYQTNGGAQVVLETTNCAVAYGTKIVTATVPLGWWKWGVIHSNLGPTTVKGLPGKNSIGRGVQIGLINAGGSRITQWTNVSSSLVTGPILSNLDPAMVFLKYLDTAAEMSNCLPIVYGIITNYVPKAYIVLQGTHPIADLALDADLILQDAYMRSFALSNRGVAYIHTRDIPSFTTTNAMILTYGSAGYDGLHLTTPMQIATGDQIMDLIPFFRNAAAIGMFIEGTKPAGAGYVALNSSNNFGDNQTVTGNLEVGGSGETLVLADRGSPDDPTKKRSIFHSAGITYFYAGATGLGYGLGLGLDAADNYHYIGPDSSVWVVSKLGTLAAPYTKAYIQTWLSTNMMGSNSATGLTIKGTANSGPGEFFGTNGNLGIGTATPGAALDVPGTVDIGTLIATNASFSNLLVRFLQVSLTNLDLVITPGLIASNETPATVGAQKVGPLVGSSGNNWLTTPSHSTNFAMGWYPLPVQGTTTPSGSYVLAVKLGGANWASTGVTIDNNGIITAGAFSTSTSVTLGSTTGFGLLFNSGSRMFSPANGMFEFTKTAAAQGLEVLLFGAGSTAATLDQSTNYPALRVVATNNVGFELRKGTNQIAGTYAGLAADSVATYRSNLLAITIVVLPASPSLWTNTTDKNVSIGWVGAAVTGVSINSSMWPTALTGGMGILQPGEYIGFTNTVIPTFGWKPL